MKLTTAATTFCDGESKYSPSVLGYVTINNGTTAEMSGLAGG